jgi:hypothetical protein
MLDHVAAQVVADRLVVPGGPGQQVLHPIRGGLTGVLGNGPTVRPRQPRQQPEHEGPGPPPRLYPREPGPDPAHQLIEGMLPAIRAYAVARGHRTIIQCRHNR